MSDAEPAGELIGAAEELRVLVSALHAHAAWLDVTGVTFLPAATTETSQARGALTLPAHVNRRDTRSSDPSAARAPSPAHAHARPAPHVAERNAPRSPGDTRAASTPAAIDTRTTVREPPPDAPSPAPQRTPRATPSDVGQSVPRVGAAPSHDSMPFSVPTATPFEARGPSDEARRRLVTLATEVAGCTLCGLSASRTQTVFSRGSGSSGICFVGEGPGADEDLRGEPFVGAAGQLLDKMIAAMGLSRDEVYVCNIVKCRPPENRKPGPEEMQACAPYLTEQLELLAPQVIVALGATAVQGLLGTTGGITRLRGTWRLYRGKIAVMPTFHPAFLLRQPSSKRLVWEDLQAVLHHVGRTAPSTK